MKRKRVNIVRLLVLTLLALYLFTPLGFQVDVLVNRVLSSSPKTISGNSPVKPTVSGWKLVDLNGDTLNTDELEGQVVLVNFWASWCAPCVAEMPSLNKLYKEFGDRVIFLFVARDKKDLVNSFLEENDFDLPVFIEVYQAHTHIHNTSLPTTYILDRKGQLVMNHAGAANWYSADMRKLMDSLLIN